MRGLTVRRWAAAALTGAALTITAGTLTLTATPTAAAETPAERCQRETAQWNAAYEATWRAANPGNPGPPPPNPAPYVCVDPDEQTTTTPSPVPTLGPAPTGENNGSGIGVRGGTLGDVGNGTDLVPTPSPVTRPQPGATTPSGPAVLPIPVPDQPEEALIAPHTETTAPPPPTADVDTDADTVPPSTAVSPAPQSATDSADANDTPNPADRDRETELLLIAAAAAGLSRIRRNPRAGRTFVSAPATAVGALPGTPIPSSGGGTAVSNQFGTSRIIPGQGVQAGFYDPDLSSPLGQKWGTRVSIDPDNTPGARGAYSGSLLTPNPVTGKSSVGVPGLTPGQAVPGGATTSRAGALDIDAVKGAQLQIVSATPVGLSTVNYGGLPELVVHYQYQYQVQYVYSFVGNAFVHQSDWTDVSPDEVRELQKMGAYVPKIN